MAAFDGSDNLYFVGVMGGAAKYTGIRSLKWKNGEGGEGFQKWKTFSIMVLTTCHRCNP